MGIYLSVPVWPEPPAERAGDRAVAEPAGSLSAEMRCAGWHSDWWSGKRLALLGRSASTGVRLGTVPVGESHAGRLAGSELRYREYLGERISVNPNRYRDCVFLLCQVF